MSTVLVCNNESHKIIITDTQLSNYDTETSDMYSNKEDYSVQKLHYIDKYNSFIAGMGNARLVYDVFKILKDNDRKNYTISNAFDEVYFQLQNEIDKELEEKLYDSSITFVCNSEIKIFSKSFLSSKGKTSQLNTVSKNFNKDMPSDFIVIDKNKAYIQFPDDLKGREQNIKLIECINQASIEKTDEALKKLLMIFKDISISKYVSDICCIGIMGCEEPFYIEGKIDSLINTIERTSISEIENQFDQCKNKLKNWNNINQPWNSITK